MGPQSVDVRGIFLGAVPLALRGLWLASKRDVRRMGRDYFASFPNRKICGKDSGDPDPDADGRRGQLVLCPANTFKPASLIGQLVEVLDGAATSEPRGKLKDAER